MARTSIEVPMPTVIASIVITKPRGFRVRMALLSAVLWVAGKVAPSNIDVQTEIVAKD
jgi:hypothetical protein